MTNEHELFARMRKSHENANIVTAVIIHINCYNGEVAVTVINVAHCLCYTGRSPVFTLRPRRKQSNVMEEAYPLRRKKERVLRHSELDLDY